MSVMDTMAGRRLVWSIARICHEVNKAYCEALGDHSQPGWAEAEGWQVESARNGVAAIIDNPGTTPRQSHENWMREKLEQGWVYGPMKDADAKTHPCLVDYDDLPVEQRAKDHIFRAVVLAVNETMEARS